MVTRIGNTAESQVSREGAGLDEGQALSLLSAVGGHGLSLVESGPATDPAGAGLTLEEEQAYYRASRLARRMGEARLAQQQIQGVLDETETVGTGAAGNSVSSSPPKAQPAAPLRGGLDSTTTAVAANPAQDSRGDRQKGA